MSPVCWYLFQIVTFEIVRFYTKNDQKVVKSFKVDSFGEIIAGKWSEI